MKTLLLVDDDHDYLESLTLALRDLGYTVVDCGSSIAALQHLKDRKFDVLITDLELPEMDGQQATMQIRQKNKHIPIIAQTALAMEGDEKKSMEAGCTDYITKPIFKKDLLDKISLYLRS